MRVARAHFLVIQQHVDGRPLLCQTYPHPSNACEHPATLRHCDPKAPNFPIPSSPVH